MASISCLHLSELRLGNSAQSALTPHYRALFYADLEAIHHKAGPFDLVLISGSLTESGTDKQFELVSKFLDELWARLASLGSTPKLLVVPGERDLILPSDDDPNTLALTNWHQNEKIRAAFWKTPTSPLREEVARAFDPYTRWLTQCKHLVTSIAKVDGIMPGDFAATVSANGLDVGIIGLNSSFLGFAQHQEMALDVLQLNAVCSDDPLGWLERQDLSLLFTTHSRSKLHETSRKHFHELIYPPGRFISHLFGDAKESLRIEKVSGAEARRYIPVPSLFGGVDTGEEHRAGYNAFRISLDRGACTLQCWPRVASKNEAAGHTRFVGDSLSWVLVEERWSESFDLLSSARPEEPFVDVPPLIFQKLVRVLEQIQEPTPIKNALCALNNQANSLTEQSLSKLVKTLARQLLTPASVSADSIKGLAAALKWLGPYLGRERAVGLLEMIIPFRWVHPDASQRLLYVTQKPPLDRVVGLTGERMDFTGRDYVRRAQGEQSTWVRVSLSKLTEYSFDEIKIQIYECLKHKLWGCDSDQDVDEHLKGLEDGVGLPVIIQLQAPPTLSSEVIHKIKGHFRTVTLVLFTGQADPPETIEVLTPRLQLEQERRAFYLYASAMTAVDES